MNKYREIVTKAVIGKGKKIFNTTKSVTPNCVPTNVLGCWVINHTFKGYRNKDKINIEGSYDVNIWYSCSDDTKTEVVTDTVKYLEVVNSPVKLDNSINNEEIIIRSLKQPTVLKAVIDGGNISYSIQKEMGIELVGDVKVKIEYNEEEDPWDIISDDNSSSSDIVDSDINEEYLDK